MATGLYALEAGLLTGSKLDMAALSGKPAMIMNVASR